MSYDANPLIGAPPNVGDTPSASRSPGQRQQWKLALEKAYLEVGRSADGPAKEGDEKTSFDGYPKGKEHRVDQQAQGNPVVPAVISEDLRAQHSSHVAGHSARGRYSDLKNVLEEAILPVLQSIGSAAGLKGGESVYAGKETSGLLKSTPSVRSADLVNDRALHLQMTENGVQLSIRHGGTLNFSQVQHIVSTVREILKHQGLELARVIVDGAEYWENEDLPCRQAAPDADMRSGEIDRTY